MKKYLVFMFFTIVLGSVFGKFLYDKTIDVSALGQEDVYFLEVMSSKNLDELENDSKDIEPKLITKDGNRYVCYIGISRNIDNINKMKSQYSENAYVPVESMRKVSNAEFLNNLEQFDQLLLKTNTKDEIAAVNSVILSSYEEMVLNK
ncbi:MAG: hypothetical protein J6B89_04170 [Bacilli bacterium]|nr:hypothetical protein [Bacilli bacterium]